MNIAERHLPHYDFRGIGRAVGGAVVFNLPLLMTMEMWWIAYYVTPLRLIFLLALSLPLLFGVSHLIGFRKSRTVLDNLLDVFVAYGFGFMISALSLYLFSTLSAELAVGVHLNAITLLTIPASLGALLGRSEVGSGDHDSTSDKSYMDEIVILSVGALFLAITVAPTEEITLISQQMNDWHRLWLFTITIVVMLIFAIACEYSRENFNDDPSISYLLSFCGTAYLTSLFISLFLLWVFGQLHYMSPDELVSVVTVLLFPAGIGAAAAKLII